MQRNEVETMSVIEHETNSSRPDLSEANYHPDRSWRTWLIGRPLATADAPHQAIGKFVGLAVFLLRCDVVGSLWPAGNDAGIGCGRRGRPGYAVPLAIGIVVLLTILTLSYEQTIHAYPGGGGAYIVARDNLGELPAQTAGAALLTDYILTVAVSISSGVAQITSAFPTPLCLSRRDRGGYGRDDHDDQSARGEGIGRHLCGADLLLPGDGLSHDNRRDGARF